MTTRQDTIWEKFLSPIFRFLIDEKALREYSESVDWEKECDYIRRPDVITPTYYSSQNFYGIKGGYLTSGAAVTYDPITQYVLPPNETWVRQGLIDAVRVKPRRILDLGCGTGTTTIMLKQTYPEAEVIGLDLSPYMLVRAQHKTNSAGVNIHWRHGDAQKTGFPDASFDLVTASLLFHETPPAISVLILRECFRLLTVGGQVVVLDGNQKTLRQLEFLRNVFEEPYIQDFSAGSVDAWMGAAGFEAVQTEDIWWIHQVTSGIKPVLSHEIATNQNVQVYTPQVIDDTGLQGFPSPA
ncbi:MAG: class I SAM-dependent methyltransferase [Calothrix sp. C42_A2020_038]|nr:class I SAM-dependent methyltransferase [Calothrix sp. C42_A2020_038]